MSAGSRLRQLQDVARAFVVYRRLRARDQWTPERLRRHQQRSLSDLLRHAMTHSPFYRDLYLEKSIDRECPLAELPVVNKQMVMENFDRLVTDRNLRLRAVREHLADLRGDEYLSGKYRALSTSGTSGLKGIFVYSRAEWSVVLAAVLRWYHLAGIGMRFPRRVRIATLGASDPMHVSARLPESGDIGVFNLRRFTVEMNPTDLADALNRFRPEVLLSYPSVAALLAEEQLGGRLAIAPRIVSTHSELMTDDMARKINGAWNTVPYNHYGLSELPTFGAECSFHRGLHAFEDLFIAELVDDRNRPVPDGQRATKLLLTNLYNRTQPLIRYEISDMLTRARERCPCGRPYPLLQDIGGRSEDTIVLPGPEGGTVAIPPLVIATAIDTFDEVVEYRVTHLHSEMRVVVVARADAASESLAERLRIAITDRVRTHGAKTPSISIEFADQLDRAKGPMGKVKRVESGGSSSGPP